MIMMMMMGNLLYFVQVHIPIFIYHNVETEFAFIDFSLRNKVRNLVLKS